MEAARPIRPGCFSFLLHGGFRRPLFFSLPPGGRLPLGKVAGRKARRMRGHFKERASLEKSRRAGARPRRPCVFSFPKIYPASDFCRGGPMWPPVRETSSSVGRDDSARRPPCGRRASFWMPRKKPKRHQGVGSDGRFAPIFACPLDPHYGGRPPGSQCVVSGAQNLSGGPRVLPGHWALSLQKLHLTRFRSCA